MTEPREASPSTRALSAASEAGLGQLFESLRVSSRRGIAAAISGVLLVAVGLATIASTVMLWGSWVFAVCVLVIGLALVGLGVGMLLRQAANRRIGAWLVHSYEQGLVMERQQGSVFAARYDELDAEYFHFWEPAFRKREPRLHVGLSLETRGSEAESREMLDREMHCVIAAAADENAATLRNIAERCGANAIGEMGYAEALDRVASGEWRGI